MKTNNFSQLITVFHGRIAPEEAILVGYGALIEAYKLAMPMPHKLSLISKKNRRYQNDEWQVFTPRYAPEDKLYNQLVFALKYDGINLLFFKKLFGELLKTDVEELVQLEPLGQYSRKIWFLYEWLMPYKLNVQDLASGNYVTLLDEKLQYGIGGKRSFRHRIINNLPGTPGFCPLIFKTKKLETYLKENLVTKQTDYLNDIRKDVLQRAAAFLLLKDSKASFNIEGEQPGTNRAQRWGKAIGQAGSKPLTIQELLRLQQLVIESKRFTKMGLRNEGGFVGEHDRTSGEPIPEHISAKAEDIDDLLNALLQSYNLLKGESFNAVLSAAMISFGFVFIHPFTDGNGRIHRYLIHHILARMNFTQQGLIFPVSASILDRIADYRKILETYSHPLLEFIDWKTTEDNSVEVSNDTKDFYSYFDATPVAEFLWDCVADTIDTIIPREVEYIQKYDALKYYLDNKFEMPDKMVALLIRFLEQNDGKFSQRAKNQEFEKLTDKEAEAIENKFAEIFY